MESENANLISRIKNHLLTLEIKNQCCKNSFLCGYFGYKSRRKTAFSVAVDEYIAKLKSKNSKRSQPFNEGADNAGYQLKNPSTGRGISTEILAPSRRCDHCSGHLLRGAFLAAGRLSVSSGNLHLEFVQPNEKTLATIDEILQNFGVEMKRTSRKNELLLYCKRSEIIEDFLNLIGASSFSFQIINDKILSDLRSEANRQINCDTSNINRALQAADMQINAINYLYLYDLTQILPPEIRRTAEIRIDNPSANLQEITEMHDEKISKSGVNHRLNKLIKIAIKHGFPAEK